MEIIIISSNIQFRSPQIGQPTRAIEEHYNGRRIIAMIDGEEQTFRFKREELAFNVTEEEMEQAILQKLGG